MAFKQSGNPLSRKTSPLRAGGFSMAALDQKAAAEKQKSINDSRSGNVGAPGDPGTQPNYDDPKKFAGDDEGMLKSTFEPQFPGDDGYEDQGMSRQDPKYFGLGKDDGTGRKIKKANKTAGQIVKMQNKRSSVKNVYLGDPDDLEGEMVRTADKPASKREVRKIKKFKKTKNQLGDKAVSPLNMHEGKKHAKSSYQPIKDKDGKVILTSEQARNIDEDFPKEKKDLKPSAADIKKAKIANDKMKALKAKAKAAKAAKATETKPGVSRKGSKIAKAAKAVKKVGKKVIKKVSSMVPMIGTGIGVSAAAKKSKAKPGVSRKASPLNNEGHAEPGKAHSHYKTKKHPDGQVPKASPQGMKNKKNK